MLHKPDPRLAREFLFPLCLLPLIARLAEDGMVRVASENRASSHRPRSSENIAISKNEEYSCLQPYQTQKLQNPREAIMVSVLHSNLSELLEITNPGFECFDLFLLLLDHLREHSHNIHRA